MLHYFFDVDVDGVHTRDTWGIDLDSQQDVEREADALLMSTADQTANKLVPTTLKVAARTAEGLEIYRASLISWGRKTEIRRETFESALTRPRPSRH